MILLMVIACTALGDRMSCLELDDFSLCPSETSQEEAEQRCAGAHLGHLVYYDSIRLELEVNAEFYLGDDWWYREGCYGRCDDYTPFICEMN